LIAFAGIDRLLIDLAVALIEGATSWPASNRGSAGQRPPEPECLRRGRLADDCRQGRSRLPIQIPEQENPP
jgi:hypothetical protein